MKKMRRVVVAGLCAAALLPLGVSSPSAASPLGVFGRSSFGRGGVVFTGFGEHSERIGQFTRQVVVEPDGKILLGLSGPFRNRFGPREGFTIERLNPDGSLDPTFGGDGSVATGIDGRAFAVQPDGRIVVAGSTGENAPAPDIALMRYLPDGKADRSFGDRGLVRFRGKLEDTAEAVALQPNGTIVVAGHSRCGERERGCGYYERSEVVLMRLRPDGRPLGTSRFDDGSSVLSLAVGAQGQPAVAIETNRRKQSHLLLRYDPDGTLRKGFGSDGSEPIGGNAGGVVQVTADDKVLLAGFDMRGGGLRLLEPEGSPDASFGNGGSVECVPSKTEYVAEGTPQAAVLPDGRLLASGGNNDCGLVRYLPDGSPDASFGAGGRLDTKPALGGSPEAIAVGPGSTAIVAKWQDGAGFRVARYLANGTLDPTFGAGGVATVPGMAATFDQANALLALREGKLLAVGTSNCATGGCGDFALARYRADGRLDTSFGHRGLVRTPLEGVGLATSAAIQRDGRIVIGGAIGIQDHGELKQERLALARYMPGGALDRSFGRGGIVTLPSSAPGEDVQVNAVAIAPDGDVVAVGEASCSQSEECRERYCSECASFVVARFHSDGNPVRGFGKDGVLRLDVGHSAEDHDAARAVAIEADGRIVVAGRTYLGAFGLLRLLPDGRPDRTFGRRGIVRTPFYAHLRDDQGRHFRINVKRPATALKLISKGRIVVAGGIAFSRRGEGTHDRGAIVRYLGNGKIDRSFGRSGLVDVGGLAVKAMSIDRCGRLVLAGASSPRPGVQKFGVTRRLPSGGLDRTFSKGIVRRALGTGEDSHANAVALSGHDIVAAGVASNGGHGSDFTLAPFPAGNACRR